MLSSNRVCHGEESTQKPASRFQGDNPDEHVLTCSDTLPRSTPTLAKASKSAKGASSPTTKSTAQVNKSTYTAVVARKRTERQPYSAPSDQSQSAPMPSQSSISGTVKKRPTRVQTDSIHASVDKICNAPSPVPSGTAMTLSSKLSSGRVYHEERHIKADGGTCDGATSRSRRVVELMEQVLLYVQCFTKAVSDCKRSLAPPEKLVGLCDSLRSNRTATDSTGELHQGSGGFPLTLFPQLHEGANMLLQWFATLHSEQLSQVLSTEKEELALASHMNGLRVSLSAIEEGGTTHTDAAVRRAFSEHSGILSECREVLDAVVQVAQHVLLLRAAVAEQDSHRVRELLESCKTSIRHKVCVSASTASCKLLEKLLEGPYLVWLEDRWFPSIRGWRRVMLETRRRASAGDVEGALAWAEREMFRIHDLQSILGRGETPAEMFRRRVEGPIRCLGNAFGRKRKAMDNLSAAMRSPALKPLSDALREAKECTEVKGYVITSEKDDEALISKAKQVLIDLQQVDAVESDLKLAQQASNDDIVSIFRSVHRANELIYRLHIADSPVQCQKVVRSCRVILAKLTEDVSSVSPSTPTEQLPGSPMANPSTSGDSKRHLVDFLPPSLVIHDLCLAHLPSDVWKVHTTTLYTNACHNLEIKFTQEQVRRALERTMEGPGSCPSSLAATVSLDADFPSTLNVANGKDTAGGSSVTQASLRSAPPTSTLESIEELAKHIERAKEVGLCGMLLEEAQSKLQRMRTLKLKVHFDSHTRLLPLEDPSNILFEEVYKRLVDFCSAQALHTVGQHKLRIQYEDCDGDYISVFTSDDWQVMLQELAPGGPQGRKIDLYCSFLLQPPAFQGNSGDAAASANDTQVNVENLAGPVTDATVSLQSPSSSQRMPPKAMTTGFIPSCDNLPPQPHNSKRTVTLPRSNRGAILRRNVARSRSTGGRPRPEGIVGASDSPHSAVSTRAAPLYMKGKGSHAVHDSSLPLSDSPPPKLTAESLQLQKKELDSLQLPHDTAPNADHPCGIGVNLHSDSVRRWSTDDVPLDLQTVASVSTYAPGTDSACSRMTRPSAVKEPPLTSIPLNKATLGESNGKRNTFTSTHCNRVPTAAKWTWGQEEEKNSTPFVNADKADGRSPTASTSSGAAPLRDALPPRPATVQTPQRRRGGLRGNPEDDTSKLVENYARAKDSAAVLTEMQQLREENQRALKVTLSQRKQAWH